MNPISGKSIANFWIEAADKSAKNELNGTEKEDLFNKTRESIKEIKKLTADEVSDIYLDFVDHIFHKSLNQQENLTHILSDGTSLQNKEGPYYVFSELISVLQSKSDSICNPEKIKVIKNIVIAAFKEIRNSRNEPIDNEIFKDSFPNDILLELFKNSPPLPPINKHWSRMENARKVQIINTTGDIRNAGFSCWLHFLKWKESISSNENTDLFDIHNINIDFNIPYTPYFLNEYILEATEKNKFPSTFPAGYELINKEGFPPVFPDSYELINDHQGYLRLNYPNNKSFYISSYDFVEKIISTGFLEKIISANPNIIKLKLDPNIFDIQLLILDGLKNLKHLDLGESFIQGLYLEDIKIDLSSLNLSRCKKIDNMLFLASMKNLKFLNLNNFKISIGLFGLYKFKNMAILKNLEYLDLTCDIPSEDIDILDSLTNLKTLKLRLPQYNNNNVTLIKKIVALKDLKELHLELYPFDVNISYLGQLKSLKALIFNGKISELQMQEIAKLSQLQKIAFYKMENADSSIFHLSSLEKLENLTILKNCSITEVGLKHLALFNHLQYLDLGANAINDAELKCLTSLENLQKNLKYLRINLTKCTGKGLKRLKKLSRLETLELYKKDNSYDNDMSWNDLKGLLSILPNLKHIKLQHDLIEQTLQDFPHLIVLKTEITKFHHDRINDEYMKKFDIDQF